MSSESFDVIVAGAGPVGLFLACELAAAGVSVLVMEREAASSSPSSSSPSPWKTEPLGRRGLNVRSIESFYRRGMLDKVVDGERPTQLQKTSTLQFVGHFAGILLDGNKLDLSRWKYHLPGPASIPAPTDLARMEAALSERAEELGAKILHGTGVASLVDEGEMVQVWTEDRQRSFRGRWLVGCDGGRSTVRKAAGFEFVGTEAEFTGYVGLCELDKPDLLPRGFTITESGMYIVGGGGSLYVVDFDAADPLDRSKPITREVFEKALHRVSGKDDVSVRTLHMASSFTDRSKQASEYRRGRVLLAGDSAHIHSPLGAQGLNAGIGDAMNLGWKLAATVKGTAPPGLLDTYHQERHPVAAWVLEWTRAQAATLRPNLYGKAVANVMRDLIATEDGTAYFVDRVWGLSQRYDLGEDDDAAHPLVGCSVPDFEFVDGQRLGIKLAALGPRFVVVEFEDDTTATTMSAAVAKLSKSLQSQVVYIGLRAKDSLGFKTLLVRPDGIVAWVAVVGEKNSSDNDDDDDDDDDEKALEKALSRWLK